MAGKLFFKPYKLTYFFEKTVSDLENPMMFKDNCLNMGYSLIALFTDYVYDLYKPELERINGTALTRLEDILKCKNAVFQNLLPISDDYVLYYDFERVVKRNEWSRLKQSVRNLIARSLEAVKQHRNLTEAGLQYRVKKDLDKAVQERT